ncbi:hypothetical protein SAY87_013688 [Trapa incisa]|uniref:DOG1 domain-containing protein n=1 Tax=Trapa incisa TaxID=236973 RepID=A0AAN7KBJ9_9MYRT|nr:hypothetical protein SAY87_013688 [Trapa incisa]
MAAEAALYNRAEGSSKSGEASTDSGSAVMNAAITGKAEAPDSIISRKVSVDSRVVLGATIFDMEYESCPPGSSVGPDEDLRVVVDGYVSHYNEIFRLKGTAAKSDVFNLITGTWATPAERCFLWMGGFRPSELIKMLMTQLDPLTEQQVMGIYSLQQSSQWAEEALSQLQRSLVGTIAGGPNIIDGVQQMAIAVGKLADLEGFVRQADHLRQQMLHQLGRILTVRQAARCFLVIGEYYGRLRALSSPWATRPRGYV